MLKIELTRFEVEDIITASEITPPTTGGNENQGGGNEDQSGGNTTTTTKCTDPYCRWTWYAGENHNVEDHHW